MDWIGWNVICTGGLGTYTKRKLFAMPVVNQVIDFRRVAKLVRG